MVGWFHLKGIRMNELKFEVRQAVDRIFETATSVSGGRAVIGTCSDGSPLDAGTVFLYCIHVELERELIKRGLATPSEIPELFKELASDPAP